MLRLVLPLLLAVLGLAAGIGGGILLRPDASPSPSEDAEVVHSEKDDARPVAPRSVDPAEQPEYVKLNNQFIVPIVEKDRVASMVILSLSLEVPQGIGQEVYAVEPKLRDGMLGVLFNHANTGGFRGSFTEAARLVSLRRALLEVAVSVVGSKVTNVLITDIMRQDG
ncbi:flagellar basal body-associated FliL family protein [Cereibacter sediminicola]|uniref:flagellar basal body-associated FliL family protein n=1 Tax=Cereibacter sediminicola TaxID=2584941 RepID=UPI00119DEB42|nr:flagellar basal body-associated FliL family protein [Cereibacter sediminicola]